MGVDRQMVFVARASPGAPTVAANPPGVPMSVVPVLPDTITVLASGIARTLAAMSYSTQLYFVVVPVASLAIVDISST